MMKRIPSEAPPALQEARPVRMRGLDRRESEAILARNHIGRLAYVSKGRVDIEPIHYIYADGVLYGRTSPGAKVTRLLQDPSVAFEVDEALDLFDWRSVVVHGTVHLVEDGPPGVQHDAYVLTVGRLRSLVPETLREGDPAPQRSVLYRIWIDTLTGREARQNR
jgi:uncharacterized protein